MTNPDDLEDLFPEDPDDDADDVLPEDAIDDYLDALDELGLDGDERGLISLNQVTDPSALRNDVFDSPAQALSFLREVTGTLSFSSVIYYGGGLWGVAIYGSP